MSISVANFITQYLRPALASATEFPDGTLGYWIDAALLDISRSFPRTIYALWEATTADNSYAYADSTTGATDTTIIRVLNCMYPYVSPENPGRVMSRKSYLDSDFIGGDYFHPDNDAGILYIGAVVATGNHIYSDCHIYWKTATTNIINPSEHYELIRLFCIWQAFMHHAADSAASSVPDSSLLNAAALQAKRAEAAYRLAYDKLNEAKATSGITKGWAMDKWDPNSGNSGTPGSVPPGRTDW